MTNWQFANAGEGDDESFTVKIPTFGSYTVPVVAV